jgi:Replication-relaxation
LLLFFLEYDTGTEPLGRLVDKLDNYTSTPERPKPHLPVLFWLHSAAREHYLHRRLATMRFPMPIATAARDHAGQIAASPAGDIWT